jgi:hypothetical protein
MPSFSPHDVGTTAGAKKALGGSRITRDLRERGLRRRTIEAAYLRMAASSEMPKAHAGAEGVYIPYWSTGGWLTGHYRIRFVPPILIAPGETVAQHTNGNTNGTAGGGVHLNGTTHAKPLRGPKFMRYWQAQGTDPHIYIPPPELVNTRVWSDARRSLIITEGEFKALRACQDGFPTIAVGGINAWLKRRAAGGDGGETGSSSKKSRSKSSSSTSRQVAEELEEIVWRHRTVWLIFDTEPANKPRSAAATQRALFELGIWLEQRGANVYQVKLPVLQAGQKTGLDDFLNSEGPYALKSLLEDRRFHRFPERPELLPWLSEQLDRPRLKSSDDLAICRAILADLDANGTRFHDADGNYYYYFDKRTRLLHQYSITPNGLRGITSTTFGKLLYSRYKLGVNQRKVIEPLVQRSAVWHPTVQISAPQNVSRACDDALYYQINDSTLVKVAAGDIAIVPNGIDDQLFLSGRVEPLDEASLMEALERGFADRWRAALRRTNIQPMPGMTLEQTHDFLACLFYLNPWFRRWRGLMLPVEAAIAEAGSGKTFLYNLRRGILTGSASLDHAPDTAKDWYASIAAAPGLWVCDNMGEVKRDVRDRVADEITRLVTDPDPHVDLRQLFTDNVNVRFPVDCTFAVTSIYTAFYKADIVQRSVLIEMKAIPAGQRDAHWYQRELGDRAGWVAEHLSAAQLFLRMAARTWDPAYLSQSRLAHFDQAIITMGDALGFGRENMTQIVALLSGATRENIAQSDPVMEALRDYAREELVPQYQRLLPGRVLQCRVSDIVDWVQSDPENRYTHIKYLGNPVQLGKYIRSHSADVEAIAGLRRVTYQNQSMLRVISMPLLSGPDRGKS